MNMRSLELTIDASALTHNWQRLNAQSSGKASAVVKANAYGFGVDLVAPILWQAGARDFFVANLDEALELANILPDARIFELSGLSLQTQVHPQIVPVINTVEMLEALDDRPFALQFDTGMTRLGIDAQRAAEISHLKPIMIMSHLASSDEPNSSQNQQQLESFQAITAHFPKAQKSLAATGGILLGKDYQFDLTRPGIGIYGGAPFMDAQSCLQIHLPILQIRDIKSGTQIGYSASFTAPEPMRVATVFGGYADGIPRALSNQAMLFNGDQACPILGRVSMDAITVDISALKETPTHLSLIHPTQTINDLAEMSNSIAYELFTGLGTRYKRSVSGWS